MFAEYSDKVAKVALLTEVRWTCGQGHRQKDQHIKLVPSVTAARSLSFIMLPFTGSIFQPLPPNGTVYISTFC